MRADGLLPRQLPLALARVGRRFPRTVIAGAVLACIVAGIVASRVRVETDILSLVPEDNPVVDAFTSTVERFGSVDMLIVVVRIPPESEIDAVAAFADELAGVLREWPLIAWVEHRLDDPMALAAPLLDRATLLLEPDEVDRLLARLEPDRLAAEAERLRAALLAPQGVATRDLLTADPMGMLPGMLERLKVGGVGVKPDPDTGCLIDSERRRLLMIVKPTGPAQDIRFDRVLADGLEERVVEAGLRWRDEGWEGATPDVAFTGGYIIALDDSELIIDDLIVGLLGSLAGVMILFLLAFRRRAALLYAFLPLVTGLALTFVFVAVALGRLNSVTSGFAALLIGLGIDFIIVLYGRYVQERQEGAEPEQAIDTVGRHTAVGVMLGAVTTAATFFAFLTTDFRGLSELGLLTGAGILLLVLAVFLVLPALLTLMRGRELGGRRLYLHSFGLDIVCRASVRRPGLTLLLVAAGTVLAGAASARLEFDDDISNMRSAGNQGVKLQAEIAETFGLRFTPMMVRFDGATEAEALAAARAALPELEALVDGHTLAGVDSIVGVIPPDEQQLEAIERLRAAPFDLEELPARFEDALREAGLNPGPFREGIEHLVAALGVRRPLHLADLKGTSLEHVVSRYVVSSDGYFSTVVFCFPPAGSWRREAPPALASAVRRHPGALLAGPNVVSAELRRIVWGDAFRAAALGTLLVYLLLWMDFGSPVRGMLALAPLLVGLVWMLGAMAVLGIRVNFMNIFVLTMVIGIGVDYGVHLLHRWEESGGAPAAIGETAKAIAVAALTTMVGFGSLVLSHYPGLRSVGAAAILGAAATSILSVTMLPALLILLHRRNGGLAR